MEHHGFDNIDQLRGILSFQSCNNTEALARAAYLKMLQSWEPTD